MNTKSNVTIISIWSKIDGLEGVAAKRTQNRIYSVEVPTGTTWAETLEHAFCLTNRDDRPFGRQVCATTAGDIMVLDGTHYLVEGCGYTKLTPEQSFAIQNLTSRDTSFGLTFLTKNNLI